MSAIALLVLIVAGWLAKQILGSLLAQQARGTLTDYVTRKARSAANLLPPDLADEYREAWLAELIELEAKPISSLRYVSGLERAARRIATTAGAPVSLRWPTRVVYRATDVGLSALSLTVLGPLLAAATIGLRVSRRGPVLFRDVRIGDTGPFVRLRFRTRSTGSRSDCRVGLTLERTSIDELPKLVNVLRGEMSIIGPPAHPTNDGRVSAIDGSKKLDARPGLTSWQVLQAIGAVRLTASEARLRDQERGLRNDVNLVWRSVTYLLNDRRQAPPYRRPEI